MADDRFIETFREEALELLGTLEHNLLELEENPHDPELVSAVFRVMHTIKGSAGMFGLERISGFAHQVESILTALREGRLEVSRDLINKTLESRDMILAMLDDPLACAGPVTPEDASFLEAFRAVVGVSEDKKGRKNFRKQERTVCIPPGVANSLRPGQGRVPVRCQPALHHTGADRTGRDRCRSGGRQPPEPYGYKPRGLCNRLGDISNNHRDRKRDPGCFHFHGGSCRDKHHLPQRPH